MRVDRAITVNSVPWVAREPWIPARNSAGKLRPWRADIARGAKNIYLGPVKYSFVGDAEMTDLVMRGGCSFQVFRGLLELTMGAGQTYVVYLDEQGCVLGTDGERYLTPVAVKPMVIHEGFGMESHVKRPCFNFLEVALKRDKGVFNIAQRVDLAALAQIIESGSLGVDDIYVALVPSNGDTKIILNIKDEEVPLATSSFRHNYLRLKKDVYLVLKKIQGRTIVSVHNVEDKHHVCSFIYNSGLNRFSYHRALNGGVVEELVDLAREDKDLSIYQPRCFLGNLFVGSVFYLSYDRQGIPEVRSSKLQLLPREEVVSDKGEKSYLYLKDGKLMARVCGWMTTGPVRSDGEGGYLVNYGEGGLNIDHNLVDKKTLRLGEDIKVYGEYGVVSKIRVCGRVFSYRTMRNRDLVLKKSGVSRLVGGLLPDEVSFIENTGVFKHRGGISIGVGGQNVRVFSPGKYAADIRTCFYKGKKFSVVAQPDGDVIYWTDRHKFSQLDHKLIRAILLLKEKPEEFATRVEMGLKLKTIVLRGCVMARKHPSLQNLAYAHDRLLEALDLCPYQEDLLGELLVIRTKLVMAKMFRKRKQQIYHDLYKIMSDSGLPIELAVEKASRYLTSKKLTALEVAYGIEIIWGAANFKYFGHSVKFQALWKNIYDILSQIPPQKIYSA